MQFIIKIWIDRYVSTYYKYDYESLYIKW